MQIVFVLFSYNITQTLHSENCKGISLSIKFNGKELSYSESLDQDLVQDFLHEQNRFQYINKTYNKIELLSLIPY